ncbi:hypothetical protein [Streptomonospora sp. PA3]|uniref:hypothetical protein n=1 Tax=Streptomonospora sp. PA3 TaxID=2607326 RepID=UPI0016435CB0|nr:hypothetical protein [Streptomonospora sp. PA3]
MSADDRPYDTPDRPPEGIGDALFAADLKRLVRASRENDEDTVSRVRETYLPE